MRVSIGRSCTSAAVGDAREPPPRVAVAEGDGLVRDVAAREHQRADAEGGADRTAGGDAAARTEASRRAPADRARRRPRPARRRAAARARSDARGEASSAPSASPTSTSFSACARSRTISAKGRSSRRLRARSARHGARVGRVAREVVAADALDGEDGTGGEPRAAAAETASPARSTASARPPASSSRARGPHAGHALGCAWKRRSPGSSYSAWQAAHIAKPAIVVAGPVVRHAAHDREARAAVGAVDERVAVAAVARVEQLREAIGTGRRVGRDQRVGLALAEALDDPEVALPGRRESSQSTARRPRAAAARARAARGSCGRRRAGRPPPAARRARR